MRPLSQLGLLVLACGLAGSGCANPAMAVPAAMAYRPPNALAVQNEDGSHYVLVEAGTRTPTSALPRMWRKKAKSACDGDYLVLSEMGHEQQRQGVRKDLASHEGWVRCISPEASDDQADDLKEDLEDGDASKAG